MSPLSQATTLTALLLATRRAARSHRDVPEVAAFKMDAERRCLALQRRLRRPPGSPGAWRPAPTRTFLIRDPKVRLITVSPFEDRVVHHALIAAVEPALERYAIHDTYACRRGRGQHAAVRRAQRFCRAAPWALKVDVASYFASVPHRRLENMLARRIADDGLLSWLVTILRSGSDGGRGLPIGSLCSQHFANLYLGRQDHWLKDECGVRRYLRYMDDSLIFGERTMLRKRKKQIVTFLEEELELRLNRRVSGVFPVRNGVPFLGWRIYPSLLRPRPASWRRARKQLRWIDKQLDEGHMTEDEAAVIAQSICAHLATGDTHRLRREFLRRSGTRQSRLQPGQPRGLLEQQARQPSDGQPQQEQPRQRQEQPWASAFQHGALVRGTPSRPDGDGLRTGTLCNSTDQAGVLRRTE